MTSRLDSISPSSSLEMSRNSRLNLAVSQREWLLQICLRRGCDYTASEFGLCSSHSNECHFPTCDDNYPNSIDGFCDDHVGQCQNQCAKTRRMILGFAQGTCLLASILDASKNPLRKLSFARCISVSAQSHSVMTWLLGVLFVSHIASTA